MSQYHPGLMRAALTLAHRWAGLTIAGFLVVSGLTGAVISWDHELDELINADLMHATTPGTPQAPIALARELEAREPRARISYIPLAPEPGRALRLGVEARVDPGTNQPYELDYNEVFVDPVSGTELGRRAWGAPWPVTRRNAISFLYVLHYSLHVPAMWGHDHWGLWLMGGIAGIWAIDCFVGFYLTLPAGPDRRRWWSRWRQAWRVKVSGSARRINFDVHRAVGLWFWAILFTIAFTGFSLNLYAEVFFPLMSTISSVTPSPFDVRPERPPHQPIEPGLDYAAVVARARDEANRRAWREPAGDAFYAAAYGVYGVSFFAPGDDHGSAGVGPARLYFDGIDGRLVGDHQPWRGTAADLFVQAQFPLHSGRILGLPGRVLISVTGIAVAALSLTGVVIWYQKARRRHWH
jgi:uncharacterized iron-regulated membrane protein